MWKTISTKEIFSHPRLTLVEDEVILPNDVQTKYLKYKNDGGSCVTIIAKDHDDKILIQREYSYPINQKLFQFPGGAVPADEKPEMGANRELMEEAGLKARNLKLLGSYLMNNRRSTMKMFVYLATDLTEKSLDADQEEDIENFWFPEDFVGSILKPKPNIHDF